MRALSRTKTISLNFVLNHQRTTDVTEQALPQLLILFDRNESLAASSARMLQSSLQEHFGETRWRIVLGCASEAGLGLEVANASVIVLLQTARVLHRANVVMQLYEARTREMPLMCLLVSRGGYDFNLARSLVTNLAGSMEIDELATLRSLLLDRGARIPAVASALETSVLKIISIPFEPSGTESDLRAFLELFSDRLVRVFSKYVKQVFNDGDDSEEAQQKQQNCRNAALALGISPDDTHSARISVRRGSDEPENGGSQRRSRLKSSFKNSAGGTPRWGKSDSFTRKTAFMRNHETSSRTSFTRQVTALVVSFKRTA